jgi:hypothetical protein
MNKFSLDGRQVQRDAPSQQNVHILEGDGLNVGKGQGVQSLHRDPA